MNIFILDENIQQSAKYHCDQHLVKMIVESAQMLSTVYRMKLGDYCANHYFNSAGIHKYGYKYFLSQDPVEDCIIKPYVMWDAYHKHPCTLWVAESFDNWCYLLTLFQDLMEEWSNRFGELLFSHGCYKYNDRLRLNKDNFDKVEMTPHPQAMPDKYKNDCAVTAYRDYYRGEKTFATWKNGEPDWL